MDKEKFQVLIIQNMESLVEVLKSEVYSDVDMYRPDYNQDNRLTDYDEVFYEGDDDGYPD